MTKKLKSVIVLCVLSLFNNISSGQISWKEVLPWEKDAPNDTDYFAFTSMSSSNENNMTIIGYINHVIPFPGAYCSQLIFRTTDGGKSWIAQNSGLPDFIDQIKEVKIEKVCAIDSLNVIAVGDSGLIIRTTDAGITWNKQIIQFKGKLRDVSFSDPDHGIIVGDYGTVCITSDGGNSWNVHSLLTNSYFHLTKAFGNGCYYVFSYYNLLVFRTFDAGQTWDSLPIINHSLKDSLWTFINAIRFSEREYPIVHSVAKGLG